MQLANTAVTNDMVAKALGLELDHDVTFDGKPTFYDHKTDENYLRDPVGSIDDAYWAIDDRGPYYGQISFKRYEEFYICRFDTNFLSAYQAECTKEEGGLPQAMMRCFCAMNSLKTGYETE